MTWASALVEWTLYLAALELMLRPGVLPMRICVACSEIVDAIDPRSAR